MTKAIDSVFKEKQFPPNSEREKRETYWADQETGTDGREKSTLQNLLGADLGKSASFWGHVM